VAKTVIDPLEIVEVQPKHGNAVVAGAQKRIEESNGRLTGLEQARAARIIAIVELALTAVLILVGVLIAVASLGSRY